MDNFAIAFIILLLFVFGSRAINNRANKRLDPDKKALLIDLFSGVSVYTFGALILIIGGFFLTLRFELIDSFVAYVMYIGLLVIFMAVSAYFYYKRFRANDFPEFYIKAYLTATLLRFIGLGIFIFIISV